MCLPPFWHLLSLWLIDSGTLGRVRWFRNTIATWEPWTPSLLLMRIVGLSAHQMTRVSGFGSGKYRFIAAWNTDVVFGIRVHYFMSLFYVSYHTPPQYGVVNNGRQQVGETDQQRTLFIHPTSYSVATGRIVGFKLCKCFVWLPGCWQRPFSPRGSTV